MDRAGQVIRGTLPSGLRYAALQSPGHTECCGITFGSGSRDEPAPADHGLAHFVEHTVFKGTPARSASYILNRMESVGGELNAYTTKEETTVYSLMPAGYCRRAAMLVGELVAQSSFPQRGIDLEREVICDEIDSYLDAPAEAAFDLFDEAAYAGNSLAHNILGTKETVAGITSEQCRDYIRRRFTTHNAVFFYLGPADPDKVIAYAERAFAPMPAAEAEDMRTRPMPCRPFDTRHEHGLHQCHTVMGVPIGGLDSPTRLATALAVNIIGGPGMNSLLNIALRERRGLVYSIDASTALYSDCGMMNLYFGCDRHDLERCRRAVRNVLEAFASKPMAAKTLEARKRQYLGQLTLGRDNREHRAISLGRAWLHRLPVMSTQELHDHIAAITPVHLQDIAATLATAPDRSLTLM